MIRPPPRSTLFPYPPLFRSDVPPNARTAAAGSELPSGEIDHPRLAVLRAEGEPGAGCVPGERGDRCARSLARQNLGTIRSEEHTSELQSPCNLVCRLLLEKK